MRLDKLSKITCVFVLALWAGPSAALAEADCATWNTRQFFAVATPADMARCLEAGANLEARGGKDGLTPLHMAAVSGSPDLVQALVQAGANLEVRDNYGLTPLHGAARYGSPDLVQALVQAGANLEARGGKYGWTPLHVVAASGSPEKVQALVQAGANLEARDDEYGLTPLHVAVSGSPEGVQALLDAGANPGARSKAGRLPFDLIGKDSRLIGTDAYWRLHDARWK